MGKSRREFMALTSMGVLGAAAGLRGQEQSPAGQNPADLPPGAPPAFGAGPAVGPEVSTTTFAEAEKLVQFEMNAGGARGGGGELAQDDGGGVRAADRAAQSGARDDDGAGYAMESGAAGAEGRAGARAVCAQQAIPGRCPRGTKILRLHR